MAIVVSGTFSGTGSSNPIVAGRSGKINVDLTFSGTATVNVQWKVDGTNWRTIDSYTASAQFVLDGAQVPVRLNCSAHTNNVGYAMLTAD